MNKGKIQILIEMRKFWGKQFQGIYRTTDKTPAKITKCSGCDQDQILLLAYEMCLHLYGWRYLRNFVHEAMLLKILSIVASKTSVKMFWLYCAAATQYSAQKLFYQCAVWKNRLFFVCDHLELLEIAAVPKNYIV